MLPRFKQAGVCVLMIVGVSLLQGAEEPAPVKNFWAAEPEGKYEFLQAPLETPTDAEIRKSLPFRRIKLKHMSPGGISASGKGFPAVIYYIEFHLDGKALLHAISGLDKEGFYQGRIERNDFARLCLLYEALISEAGDPDKFGREFQSSHPIVSELTLTMNGSQATRKHRNDYNFGDFKFWVFENVFENIESKVKWEKVEE